MAHPAVSRSYGYPPRESSIINTTMDQRGVVSGSTPPKHVVLCVDHQVVDEPTGHRHVVALEAAIEEGRTFRWTLVQVIAAIRDGAQFLVGGNGGEQTTLLEPVVCPHCPQVSARTAEPHRLEARPTCG